jgi:hypothetical protein
MAICPPTIPDIWELEYGICYLDNRIPTKYQTEKFWYSFGIRRIQENGVTQCRRHPVIWGCDP